MTIKKWIITLAPIVLAFAAEARDLPVPHGPDIEPRAGACGLGENKGQHEGLLGQTSKAGIYTSHCASLTDAEICLATIKGSMDRDGQMTMPIYSSPEKVQHCLDTFKAELLGE